MMKKLLTSICLLTFIVMMSACQNTGKRSETVFGNPITGDGNSYSVKGISWGASAKEVQKTFSNEKLTAEEDRLITEAFPLYGAECVKIYTFTDKNQDSLCSATVSLRCKTKESYQKLLEQLYRQAQASMPNQCMQGDVKSLGFQNNLSWQAADNSYVFYYPSEEQLVVNVQVTMPKEAKKGLIPG